MSSKSAKVRADELLARKGLAPSRSQAHALIMAGKVRTGPDAMVEKPGRAYPEDTEFFVEAPPKYVSRGGLKLELALASFGIDPAGLHCLDVGASTGGFTDCMLQHGATGVTCVDVGHGQLHDKMRRDPRVTNFEKVNGRNLAAAGLPRAAYDLVVADLSFISLTKVLPSMWGMTAPGGRLVTLVKPQFECTRAEADKGKGVIRDSAVHERVVGEIRDFVSRELAGAEILGVAESPITGGDGNREFLIAMRKA
jgi:23S rRNA (cytidine1920-2'-O)/16S rRNA (cytidine1409-2'-O)-methyltransferase